MEEVIYVKYEGRSINTLQYSAILLVFANIKNPKYTICREFNSEYQLWVILWWRHCDIKYGDVAVEAVP